MILFYQPDIRISALDPDESRHCVKVLRHKPGDRIRITDGLGAYYDARIDVADPRKCTFSILRRTETPAPQFSISVAMAPAKSLDRTEWFAEKAAELGVDNIWFFQSQNSERSRLSTDRIRRVCISAMKQSLRARLPQVSDMLSFSDILDLKADQRFIAHADPGAPHLFKATQPGKSYLVLIGPEGDFTDSEIATATQQGMVAVTLGEYRLRTETAALVAVQTLALKNI